MEAPGYWDQVEQSQAGMRELNTLKEEKQKFEDLQGQYEDIETLLEMGYEEDDPSLIPEIQSELDEFVEKFETMRIKTLLSGEYDRSNAILKLNAGAGGTESCICPIGVAGFAALTALSGSEDPERCSIPFDKDRDGFVMGEGAGVVILEDLEHAKARGAHILAEVVGYGATSDAYHITSPAEDGMGAATAMKWAVEESGAAMEDIMYINAHGTSTHHNDLFETRAIKLAFGEHAKEMKINSTKSMIGHLLGAAGAVEFITCVKEMEESFVHVTRGLEHPDEELDLDYVQGHGVEMDLEYALSNSLGFGGHNASILIKKYAE